MAEFSSDDRLGANADFLAHFMRDQDSALSSFRDQLLAAEEEVAAKRRDLRRAETKEERKAAEEALNAEIEAQKRLMRQKEQREKEIAQKAAEIAHDQWKEGLKKRSAAEKIEIINRAKLELQERIKNIDAAEKAGAISGDAASRARAEAQAQFADVSEIGNKISLSLKGTLESAINGLGENLGKAISSMNSAVDSALSDITSYQSKIEARLQGSGASFSRMEKDIKGAVSASPFIKQKELYSNLSTLIDKGIAYNVEERAFLQTMTDKIVTTFDAFDSNLLRLVRLQQADITAARMGMEADLTQVLNSMFHDTSYLSDVYDSVSAAIVDASAVLGRGPDTSFEYNVQKWLGALYSLGFSSSAIESIAQGINYLATGNVAALTGNKALSSLFALSAARGELDYASALSDGIDGSGVNKLMQGMIYYLQEIADNTDSKIVKSAYADLFGMTIADLKAVRNLTEEDITSLAYKNMSNQTAIAELANQFTKLPKRMAMGEMVSNVFENLIYASASGIASSPALYATWLITSAIEDATGGTKIPSPFAVGTGVNLPFTVEGLVKAGVGIGSLLTGIPGILSSLGSIGRGMSWDTFDYATTLSRGTLLEGLGSELTRAKSRTEFYGSESMSDIKNQSLAEAVSEADRVSEVTGTGGDQEHDFEDLYNALFSEGSKQSVRVELADDALRKLVSAIYSGVDTDQPVNASIGEFLTRIHNNTDPLQVSVKTDNLADIIRSALQGG